MTFKGKLVKTIKEYYKIYSLTEFINRKKRRFERLFYRKKYSSNDLMNHVRGLGLTEGDTVLVHSSWNEFYNCTGTINEFIDGILNIIGPNGTLVMPAYPFLRKKDSIFDIKRTPTEAGIIAETFRNYPGVKRSINMHSVCALGSKADYLLNEHFYSETCWDVKSPYYKLANLNGKVLSFGLGKYFVGTIIHCADSILRDEVAYFSLFFKERKEVKYKIDDKIISHSFFTSSADFRWSFTNRAHRKIIEKEYDKSKYKLSKISNLNVNIFDAEYFINRTIYLGRNGITRYNIPNPKKYF